MLEISQLVAGYNAHVVAELRGLSLKRGEHCLILGASGSGKTTLLCTIAGLLSPIKGEVTINATNVTALAGGEADKFRSRHIGFIFQALHMVQALSVLDNLLLVRYASGLPVDRQQAVDLLDKLGIANKMNTKPAQLSQGQQQRVAIARAVINRPMIILGDEPTSALDDASCATVMNLLFAIADEVQASLIIATHDQRIKSLFHHRIEIGGGQ